MHRTTILLLCLGGCLPAPVRPPVRPPECPAATASPPVAAIAGPAAPVATEPPRPLPEPDPSWSLTPAAIVLQLEEEPTLALVSVEDPTQPFGRVAPFTMYSDGTAIFDGAVDGRSGVYTYRFSDPRASAQLEHVMGLGFPRIRSHTSSCLRTPQGEVCLSDADVAVVRARLPGGTLREVRSYAGWAPGHQAQLHAIYDRIELLRAPQPGTTGTRLYLPRAATLFLHALHDSDDIDAKVRASARPWPLAAGLIERARAAPRLAVVLEVGEIQAMIAATGTNQPRHLWFAHGEHLVQVTMIPWLPGADHRAAVEAANRATPG